MYSAYQGKVMKSRGFTLIEMMVVLVITAILAAVAYPSYQQSVRETRRGDAKEALSRAASFQERHFFANNQYTSNTDDIGGASSSDGHYVVAVLGNSVSCTSNGVTFPCYTIVASATGDQANDKTCGQFSIDHTGRKRSFNTTNSPPVENTTSGECW